MSDKNSNKKSEKLQVAPKSLTHKEILFVLSGLMVGMLLAALDQTIVSTALKSIVEDFDGLAHYTWVVTAYLLTSTASTPLYGKISDLYGRRPVFQFAIITFLIGSFAAGAATSMEQLIAFRAVQGAGRLRVAQDGAADATGARCAPALDACVRQGRCRDGRRSLPSRGYAAARALAAPAPGYVRRRRHVPHARFYRPARARRAP